MLNFYFSSSPREAACTKPGSAFTAILSSSCCSLEIVLSILWVMGVWVNTTHLVHAASNEGMISAEGGGATEGV